MTENSNNTNYTNLDQFGWDRFFENNFFSLEHEDSTPARVTGVRKNLFAVHDGSREILASVAGRFFHGSKGDDLFPAAGDWVELKNEVITRVLPRKNALSRGASGARGKRDANPVREQVIAANLDHVVIVCGLDRDYNIRRIERYLALIYNCGCSPIIVLNKADLHDSVDSFVNEVESTAFGVPVHAISAKDEQGAEVLSQYIPKGKTAALVGSSGVGKSTMVNSLAGRELRAARQVSQSVGKGVHTTTSRDLILIPGRGMIIDNPGIREIAFWENDDGVESAFPDIEELAGECRFKDCRHELEPGCRVRQAVEDGGLAPDRLESYLKMKKELDYFSQRRNKSADRVEKERWKGVAQEIKRMKSGKR